MKENSERAGALYVIASAVLFGLMPLLAKVAYASGANAFTAAFGRFFTGSVMAFAYLEYKDVSLRVGRRQMGELAFLSVFYALTPVLLYLSYGFIGSGLATTLHFTYPVAVMCLMGLFFRASFTPRQVLCAALCAAGIFLLYRPGRNADGFGMALAAASGLFYAGYIIALGRSHLREVEIFVITFWISLFSALMIGAFAALTGGLAWSQSAAAWAAEAGLGLLATVLALAFFQKGLFLCGEVKASLLSTFEPLTSIAVGLAVYGEPMTPRLVAGMALILLSSVLLVLGRSRVRSAGDGVKKSLS
ncbi:MAG: DMT family transporter [Pyramidobacter porci]|uniref:DMT family transporter n=1 Tax=Pyramidobacter porci TaxID=2605789 RepID=UPI002A75D70C|nr:DMT family transporter [Pyramidobacter porci]MDY2649056.1 DMT family transporter [Pyramidobacter porci]